MILMCIHVALVYNTLQNIFKYIFLLEPRNPVMQIRNYWSHFIYKVTILKAHLIVIKYVSNNSIQGMGTNFCNMSTL